MRKCSIELLRLHCTPKKNTFKDRPTEKQNKQNISGYLYATLTSGLSAFSFFFYYSLTFASCIYAEKNQWGINIFHWLWLVSYNSFGNYLLRIAFFEPLSKFLWSMDVLPFHGINFFSRISIKNSQKFQFHTAFDFKEKMLRLKKNFISNKSSFKGQAPCE